MPHRGKSFAPCPVRSTMSTHAPASTEVFSVGDIARVAGVTPQEAQAVIESRRFPALQGYLAAPDAVRTVRLLRQLMAAAPRRDLFAPPPPPQQAPWAGVTSSAAVHAAAVVVVVLATSLGLSSRAMEPPATDTTRLVFLATPGLGGGGGGGGTRRPDPPPKARMATAAPLRSPVPPPRPLTSRRPEPVLERPKPTVPTPVRVPVEPPPAPPAVQPQVVAPVPSASADARNRAGVLTESPTESDSQGRGAGGGAGTGTGTGIGEGSGAGIGPGSGGGTGGGPYRPGSGITPPDLLREVRPDYTEDARRMGIEGDVVLEIIVRADGSVGDVKVLSGLRGGLDRRAIDAVRQWRFAPARRYGTPVDVVVEVAVEFKLR